MKLLNVARWEFLKTAKSRSFLVMVFLIPLLMGAFGGIPLLVEHLSSHSAKVIAVIDETHEIYSPLEKELQGSAYHIERVEGNSSELEEQLKEGEIDGYLLIGTDIYETNQATFYAKDIGNLDVEALNPSSAVDLECACELLCLAWAKVDVELLAGSFLVNAKCHILHYDYSEPPRYPSPSIAVSDVHAICNRVPILGLRRAPSRALHHGLRLLQQHIAGMS
mgnify:CR=1 FL=1